MAYSDDKTRRLEEAAAEFNSSLESRNQEVREADTTSIYAIRLGASNPPFDCEIFSPDYRGRLPERDPVREQGGDLRKYGTEESLKTMAAAHNACLIALGVLGRS